VQLALRIGCKSYAKTNASDSLTRTHARRSIADLKIAVREAVSVIGHDNTIINDLSIPLLTSVDLDKFLSPAPAAGTGLDVRASLAELEAGDVLAAVDQLENELAAAASPALGSTAATPNWPGRDSRRVKIANEGARPVWRP
jgi:hypothetical protein